jgi:hypothetical protein
MCSVAISPHNAGHIYAVGLGGGPRLSTDGGVTFSADVSNQYDCISADVAWHPQVEGFKSLGEVEFDPTQNTIVMAAGVGAWKVVNPPTSITFATVIHYTGFSYGIENMVMATATVAPDGTRGYTMLDRGCMIVPAGNAGKVFPSGYGPNATNLDFAMQCDCAPEDNAFWVATHIIDGTQHIGWTPDRGKTWTLSNALVTQTGGRGAGQIAVLSKDVALAIQLSTFPYGSGTKTKNALYLTMNLRAPTPTWTEVVIGNGNAVMANLQYNFSRRTLMKDRFSTGNSRRVVFYTPSDVDNPTSADTLACRGFWEILVNMTTGATTVTRKFNGTFMPSNMDSYFGHLTQISATDWLWSGGDNAVNGLFRIHDNGTNAWSVTNVTGTDDQGAGSQFAEVFAAAAGKPKAGSTIPTLYVAGYRMNTPAVRTNDHSKYGLWRSEDDGVNWIRQQQWPGGRFDMVVDMVADPNNFGKLDILFGGSGAVHVDYLYELAMS